MFFHSSSLVNRDLSCGPLDDSLTNIQWLGRMSTFEPNPDKLTNKENQNTNVQTFQVSISSVSRKTKHKINLQSPTTQMLLFLFAQAQNPDVESEAVKQPMSERPPYSYMAMIQFAINSRKNRRMTLKEIYTWIEDHFPYYRDVAKPGWKVGKVD